MLWFLSCTPCLDDVPCSVGLGKYHVVAPKSTPTSVWMYFHGWSGSPHQYIHKSDIERVVEEHGVLLVLPQGKDKTWSVSNMGGQDSFRDEETFVQQIFDDVAHQYSVDGAPRYLSGFSLGASLAEQLACDVDLKLSGIAPISGGFWTPVPISCTHHDFSIRHVHGMEDRTWPWAGRTVGTGTQASQDDIQSMWRKAQNCSEEITEIQDGPLTCISWEGCSLPVSWCTHNDEHRRLSGWFSRMIADVQRP